MTPPRRSVLAVTGLVLVLAAGCHSAPHRAGPRVHRTAPPRPLAQLWVAPNGHDTSPGTRAHPLREVQRAAAVARPGTLVHVAPGRYRPVDSSRSGTKAAPIVFWSESPWQAKVEGRGAVTAWDNTGDWVVVDGFDISGSTYNGILSTGSHGRFRGNHVHDLRGPNCTRGGAGIVMETYTAVDNDTTGNVVERIIAPGNCARVHGIYYQSADGGRILNNVVATCSGWGIHLWHDARRIRISNNTVVGNAHGGIAVGGSLEGNDLLPGIASGVIVTNNLVTENGQAGIIEIGRVGRNTFAANLSTNNSGADYSLGNGHRPVSLVRGEPDFVDPVRDYHLRPGSAALDAGIRQGAPAADLDGARRPQGAGVDIGAYEGAR